MGVKGFYKLIESLAPGITKTVKITELKGTIAIDASLAIYQWFAAGQTHKIEHNGKNTNHILGMWLRTTYIIANGLTPIFVFDGVPPELKEDTLAARRMSRKVNIPKGAFDECRELLTLMGVSAVTAPSDAEATAAHMTFDADTTSNKTADFVHSQDSDALVFGASALIRDIDLANGNCTVLYLADILAKLELTREQFVAMCVLIGTDYNTSIVGPKTAYKLARNADVTTIIQKTAESRGVDPKNAAAAYDLFMKVGEIPTIEKIGVNPDGIANFLTKFGVSRKRIDLGMSRLIKK